MLLWCASIGNLRELRAARKAVAIPFIQPPKAHVVPGIHHHRDHVLLPDAHFDSETIRTRPPKHGRLLHLGREHSGISIEVLHDAFKIRSFRAGNESGSAPAMLQSSR